MLAATGPSYSAALVDRAREPECVGSLMFGQAVVALGSGDGVGCQLVEGVEPGRAVSHATAVALSLGPPPGLKALQCLWNRRTR